MGFLVPAFLGGLAAIGIPIWVHLRHRERKEPVAFPSLMFLRKIPFREVRRQQIHHLPLFLLRVLAVALLAFAFARPFFRRADTATALLTEGAREVVILLDRSWSMGYGDRWSRAVSAARDAVAGFTGGDRGTLIAFDEDAAGLTTVGAEPASILLALDTLRPGPRTTRFDPAIKAASEVLASTDRPRKEVVLITDFQRLGWPEQETARLPAGTVLTRVDLSAGSEETPDLLLAGVELRRVKGEQQVAPAARVVNRGSMEVNTTVELTVNGRSVGKRPAQVAAGGATIVPFDPFPLPEAASQVTLAIPSDKLDADNVFHATATRENPLPVLLVSRQSDGAAVNLFLERALGLGSSPTVRLDFKNAATFRASDLNSHAVVILNDVPTPNPGGELGRALSDFVDHGGGLLLVLGEGSGSGSLPDAIAVGRAGNVVDRVVNRGATLAAVEREHPIFEVFQAPRSGDLSAARFFRYRKIEPNESAQVIARFDDGNPALVERRAGKGHVVALAAPLDNVWSDLPVQPVFLPLVHQVTIHLAGWREAPPYHTVGGVVRLEADRLGATGSGASEERAVVVIAPSGDRRRVALEEGSATLLLDAPGFWEVRRPGVGGRLLSAMAVNVDLAEADLKPLDPEEFSIAVTPAGPDTSLRALAGALPPSTLEKRQRTWWYLLVVLAALLAAETLYANRLSGFVRRAPEGP